MGNITGQAESKGPGSAPGRKPDWLKVKLRGGQNRGQVEEMLKRLSLNTVCKEANCPNQSECFCNKTATFMILGKVCTRNCTFCNVSKGAAENVDAEEPMRVAEAMKELGLQYVVITSVTRDDMADGGAGHFARVIREIKKTDPGVTVEVLIPDFKGSISALGKVAEAEPDIISHNVETVERLYPEVRPMASYGRTLELLSDVNRLNDGILSKSGIMVGLGENKEEVIKTFRDLRSAGCDILTVGQYLAPSGEHHPVAEYIHPDLFKEYKRIALEMGFQFVASAPLVRSSYRAGEIFI
ncbi:MAG TPA: lipoyl synthase [Anaerovoracaceae bacterium]|nr:lipoyl synthase [Anaerovoracaceae bacterium]